MKNIVFILLISCLSKTSFGQVQQKVLADKIISTVGDKFILYSDVQNAILDYKRQVQANNIEDYIIPKPCQVLSNIIIKKILVLQAQRDSLPISEDEIDAALEARIRNFISQFGSKEVLEEVAGKSVYQLKEDYKDALKEQKLSESMQNKVVESIKITPNEVEDFYNKIPKDSLLIYESEVELSQVVIHPKANPEIEVYVAKQLNEFRKELERGGKKFENFVKLYSEDPAAKENGGQYSLNKNDKQWDPTFLSASFRLKDGQISPVIKSKFGYHIILMVSKNGDDAIVKHILRIPPITDEEVKKTITYLDSFRNLIETKQIRFAEVVSKVSDDDNSKFTGGAITDRFGSNFITLDNLDKETILALKKIQPGEVSKPIEFTDERGRKGIKLIYFKSRSNPHKENLKDDYNKVSQRALETKRNIALEKWIKEKIPNFYITLDEEYKTCLELEYLNANINSR